MLTGCTIGAAIKTSRVFGAQSPIQGLKNIAASRGLQYGATTDISFEDTPQAYRNLFFKECGLFAPILSWKSVSRTPFIDGTGGQGGDIALALAHGLRLTGAHLLWPAGTPIWFEEMVDFVKMQTAITDHILTMTKRFSGKVWSWNVINELINVREGRPDGLRNEVFVGKLGTSFIARAFHSAREGDPNALLVYNDYGLERATPEHEARRRSLLRFVEGLVKLRVPIDAVGLQSHLFLDDGSWIDENSFRRFLKDIAALGCKIIITELDVFDKIGASDLVARDRRVADAYSRYLNVVLDEPAVAGLITWGLSDKYSWLNLVPDENHKRPDRAAARPLPFDNNFNPKPAYFAIADALRQAPMRK